MRNEQVLIIREYLGLTQEQFAELVGVSKSLISHVEWGSRRVSENLSAKIARKFDVKDPDFLAYQERRKWAEEYFFKSVT